MGKLVVNTHLITPEKAQALIEICPFGAISYENGTLDISSGCKMCKMCVKKGQGLVDFIEETKEIDKSLWKGICVYADCTGGIIHRVTFELCGKAKELAAVTGHPVYALIIGSQVYNAEEVPKAVGRGDRRWDSRFCSRSLRGSDRPSTSRHRRLYRQSGLRSQRRFG